MKYLDLLLAASFKAKFNWDAIIEKIERRLARWKKLNLSEGSRVTLINSTLSNIPTYFLSLFLISVGVAKQFEKLHWNFFVGVVWIINIYSISLIGRRFVFLFSLEDRSQELAYFQSGSIG